MNGWSGWVLGCEFQTNGRIETNSQVRRRQAKPALKHLCLEDSSCADMNCGGVTEEVSDYSEVCVIDNGGNRSAVYSNG